jgi:hypothetical protein
VSEDKSLSELASTLNGLKEQVEENKDDLVMIGKINKQVKAELDKAKSNSRRAKGVDKAIDIAESFMSYKVAGIEVLETYAADLKMVRTLNEFIDSDNQKIKGLKDYKTSIEDTMAPMVSDMIEMMSSVVESANGTSGAVLDLTKWKVQDFLQDIKVQFKSFTDGFSVTAGLMELIDKLGDSMMTIISIFDRIQGYQDQQNLFDYIADINSAAISSVKSTPYIIELQIKIKWHLIHQKYRSAMKSFKQWVFPFADAFLKTNEDSFPQTLIGKDDKTFSDNVHKVIDQVHDISKKIAEYKSTIKDFDEFLAQADFNDDFKSSEPFYVWENDRHGDQIAKLLSGERVFFFADIKDSNKEKQAIKFNQISFRFKLTDNTKSEAIEEAMKHMTVSATHSGNSYYTFGGKFYAIEGGRKNIVYSVELKGDGRPVITNAVYDKILNGDLMLSPYAMWEIYFTGRAEAFEQLKEFKNQVNLQMIGHGSYVRLKSNLPDFKIDEYYQDELLVDF